MKINIAAVLGITLGVVSLFGCTDADRSSFGAYGANADVVCYSGGKEIFRDVSTGAVSESTGGNGIYFRSSNTGHMIHTYADCIVSVR